MHTDTVVPPAELRSFAARVLVTLGVPDADADLVADSLVVAEEWGHPSHGLLRLPWYAARLRTGRIQPVTHLTVLSDRGALVSVDGNGGVGQVVTARAMDLAVARAKEHGIGAVGVRNSNHFGTAAYFTRRAVAAGCAAILTTNGSPAMAPWGGLDKAVGANPWSFAAPDGRGDAAVLDIANTGVARGKIYAAAEKGEELPDGWALDAQGRPTTDPAAALDGGVVLPMGGHKGYAISFMMDVFSGVLTGSSFGLDVGGPWQPDAHSGAGHVAIAIDIAAFQPAAEFDRKMDALIAQVKGVRRAPDAGEILYPGELENRHRAEGRGIHLPEKTVADLRDLAAECGVDAAW